MWSLALINLRYLFSKKPRWFHRAFTFIWHLGLTALPGGHWFLRASIISTTVRLKVQWTHMPNTPKGCGRTYEFWWWLAFSELLPRAYHGKKGQLWDRLAEANLWGPWLANRAMAPLGSCSTKAVEIPGCQSQPGRPCCAGLERPLLAPAKGAHPALGRPLTKVWSLMRGPVSTVLLFVSHPYLHTFIFIKMLLGISPTHTHLPFFILLIWFGVFRIYRTYENKSYIIPSAKITTFNNIQYAQFVSSWDHAVWQSHCPSTLWSISCRWLHYQLASG